MPVSAAWGGTSIVLGLIRALTRRLAPSPRIVARASRRLTASPHLSVSRARNELARERAPVLRGRKGRDHVIGLRPAVHWLPWGIGSPDLAAAMMPRAAGLRCFCGAMPSPGPYNRPHHD